MHLLTVGQMARSAGISRTSLLYYERAGLLRPAARSAPGYRLYGQTEVDRLRALRIYREAGIPLADVGQLLSTGHTDSVTVLQRRMVEIDRQIHRLRFQQRLLARLMAHPTTMTSGGIRTKAKWVALLQAAGFTENDMEEWHHAFEADAPQAHQEFLAALGLSAREVSRLRAWSRNRATGSPSLPAPP